MAANNSYNDKLVLPNERNFMFCHEFKVNSEININTAATIETIRASENFEKLHDILGNKEQRNDLVPVVPPQSISLYDEKSEINTNDKYSVKSELIQFPIQNGYEMGQSLSEYLENTECISGTDRRISLPAGFRQQRKRKRFSFLGTTDKRRFSVSGAALSVCSFLDCVAKRESKSKFRF